MHKMNQQFHYQKWGTMIFIAVVVTKVSKWKQPKCLSNIKTHKLRSSYEQIPAVVWEGKRKKKEKILLLHATWMNLTIPAKKSYIMLKNR